MEKGKLFKLFKLDRLIDSISAYVETRLRLFKLEMGEQIAELTEKLIQGFVLVLLFYMALMLFSLAGCIFLGVLLDSYSLGFLIGGGFYLLLGLLVYAFRNQWAIKEKINQYLGDKIKEDNE